MHSVILTAVWTVSTMAFPFVADMPGVDTSMLRNARRSPHDKRQLTCPFNPNHPGAARYNSKYPYTGAKNGLPGTGVGGIKVPADGDTAHAFEAPGANDIRGPCPGLNAAANHHFLSHDGITTFNELVDMQQNLYNAGYDLSVLLATIGVALDGDVVTQKVSIGCDATSRTSVAGSVLGPEVGLNGHNKFEADASLSRNDFFLANGDDYSFNGTLFKQMANTCQNNFNRDNMAFYRSQRYAQSKADNGNFYFGPKQVLLYGAASFLYSLFPSLGNGGAPDLATQKYFFGAQDGGNGGYTFNNHEQIPPNWYNRKSSFKGPEAAAEIASLYLKYPVLFGGNAGKNNFNAISFGPITNGNFPATAQNVWCLLYQIATENVPSSLTGVLVLPLQVVAWATGKLNPVFKNSGCPLKTL